MNKRTKALSIPMKVKKAVWDRQGGRSIVSGKPITVYECCCHFVPRSKGGLGIEENIVGLTYEEHMILDNNLPGNHSKESKKYKDLCEKHLKEHYPNWDRKDLVYVRRKDLSV